MKKFFVLFLLSFFSVSSFADNASVAKIALSDRTLPIDGTFLNYGVDKYDWLYITADASYVAKLAGMKEDVLQWETVHSLEAQVFESVSYKVNGINDDYNVVNGSYDINTINQVVFGHLNDDSTTSPFASLADTAKDLTGYFLHYGAGAYDWVYVSADTKYIAKLEGMDESGVLQWAWMQTPEQAGFEYVRVNLEQKEIKFWTAENLNFTEEECTKHSAVWVPIVNVCKAE